MLNHYSKNLIDLELHLVVGRTGTHQSNVVAGLFEETTAFLSLPVSRLPTELVTNCLASYSLLTYVVPFLLQL